MEPIDSEVPEIQTIAPETPPAETGPKSPFELESAPVAPAPPAATEPWETRVLLRILLGPQGLRGGWSVALFFILLFLFAGIVGFAFVQFHLISNEKSDFTPGSTFFGELVLFLGMVGAAAVVGLIERRRGNLLAFNLEGPHRIRYFIEGLIAGFLALSALIGFLAWGHWLTFGPVALSGVQIIKFAMLWGLACLMIGCVEEGICRCYLLFTLTRSINFWWAFGIVGAICLKLIVFNRGNAIWGVYIIALLGLVPCLLLHLNKAESSGFWQAAWVTSTMFGLAHTGNDGENWIGIFAAAAIGFVFVVSVRVTGSAWWAIGCHAAWDWTETYFYGAADSGNVAHGHYLTTNPVGSTFWSGGADGPEGSILVVGALLLMLVALIVLYGRKKPTTVPSAATELAVG